MALLELEDPLSPKVVKVFIETTGVGSPSDWNRYFIRGSGDFVRDMHENEEVDRYQSRSKMPADSDSDCDISLDNQEPYLEERRNDRGGRISKIDDFEDLEVKERSGQSLEQVLDQGICRPSLVTLKSIHILSRNLLRLLQSVVQDYPGQSLKGDKIIMLPPFEMLAHYYNDLIALRDRKPDILLQFSHEGLDDAEQLDLPNPADLLDQATIQDLDILVSTFNGHYIKEFAPVEARYNLGVTSFEILWFLFKPGVNVYARFGGKLAGFIFERYEKIPTRNQDVSPGGEFRWVIHCWSLTYNGRRIVRTPCIFHINKFRGEKQITSLPVFPSI
jgi:hypothetical protein